MYKEKSLHIEGTKGLKNMVPSTTLLANIHVYKTRSDVRRETGFIMKHRPEGYMKDINLTIGKS